MLKLCNPKENNARANSLKDVEGIGKGLSKKSFLNRIYLKKKFSFFKMEEDKTLEENFDLIADLASI